MSTRLTRTSLLTTALLALSLSTSVLAQSRKPQKPDSGQPTQGPISVSLGEITMDPNAMKASNRKEIAFMPLEMVDPATGQPVSPDYLVKLPNGKEITAGEYYAKLNEIEKHLNEKGYSLRDKKTIVVQEAAIDEGLLSRQKATVEAAHRKTGMSPALLAKRFGTDAVRSGEAFRVDLAAASINAQQTKDFALSAKKNIGLDLPPDRLIVDPQTLRTIAAGQASGKIGQTGFILNTPTNGKTKGKEDTREFVPIGTTSSWTSPDIGDPRYFTVNVTGRLEVAGEARSVSDAANPQNDLRNFAVRTDVRATGTLQGRPMDLLRANGSIEDEASSNIAHARMNVSVAGNDVYNFDQSLRDTWEFTDHLRAGTLDYHYHSSISIIWGIQVGVTIGVRGEAGCQYNLSLLPTHMGAAVTPYVRSNAYAHSDVNFVDLAIS